MKIGRGHMTNDDDDIFDEHHEQDAQRDDQPDVNWSSEPAGCKQAPFKCGFYFLLQLPSSSTPVTAGTLGRDADPHHRHFSRVLPFT